MAWNVVQSKAVAGSIGASGGTLSVSLTSTPTVGNKILVAVDADSGSVNPTFTVADGNSVSLTSAGSIQNTTGHDATGLFFYDVPATPSKTFTTTVTFAGGGDAAIFAMEVSGLATGNTTGAALDGTAGTHSGSITGNGTATGASYTSNASNEMLVAVFGDFGNGATANATGGTGSWTTDANSIQASATTTLAVGYKNSNNTAETDNWTITTNSGADQYALICVAFKLSAAAPAFMAPPALVVDQSVKRAAYV